MLQFIVSFFISIFSVLLISFGCFLVFASRDYLIVRYQNYRLSSTGRPLKDEDFPRIQLLISSLRVFGACMLLVGIGFLAYGLI